MDNSQHSPFGHRSVAKNIRITLAIALLVSCSLIGVIGLTSWETLKTIDEQISEIVEFTSLKTSLLYDMRIAARERNIHLIMILLKEDAFEIDDEWMMFRNQGSLFLNAREKFIKLGLDEKEKALLENQRQLSKDAVVMQYEIYDYIMKENRVEAINAFNRHAVLQSQVFEAVDVLLDFQKQKNIKKIDETKNTQVIGIKTVVILSGSVIIVLFLITIFIIKRLSQQAVEIENEGLKFKALIEGGKDSVLVLDWKGVTDCNINAFEMFAVNSLREFNDIGLDYFSGFSEENKAEESDEIFSALNHVLVGSRRTYQWEFVDVNKRRFPADVELTGVELQGESYVQMIIRDVTEREDIQKALRDANENLENKVLERTEELKELNTKMVGIARSAGMAEVASGVLHNVGNVLNSVNVSTSILRDQVRNCKSDKLENLVDLLCENKDNLADFLENSEKGKMVVPFIRQLSVQLAAEQKNQLKEINGLSDNIDHIKNIITMQQTYTGSAGVIESLKVSAVFEDAIKINIDSIKKHQIRLVREFGADQERPVDRHRLIQILVNLISNSKYAVENNEGRDKIIVVGLENKNNMINLYVEDNGIGIEKEDLVRVFEFGFKKRVDGHGYGLHHSALVANEMGGRLSVESDGLGKGARFVLQLPLDDVVSRRS